MLHFDKRGFLFPYDVILSDIPTFHHAFVDKIPDPVRIEIFENFIQFAKSFLADLSLINLQVFLDGSFTTLKRTPNDLDIVVCVDLKTFQRYESLFQTKYHRQALLKNRLDIYFIHVYPDNHPNHIFTESDRLYWINQFTRTRPDYRGIIHKKGVIELILSAHEI